LGALRSQSGGHDGAEGMRIFALVFANLAVITSSVQLLSPSTALVGALLGLAMVTIAAIDADRFIIPDWLSLPAIPLGLLASGQLLHPEIDAIADAGHIAGAIVGGGSLWLLSILYHRWRHQVGLGFGDVKLAAAAGAWVGLEYFHIVLLLASGVALLTVAVTGVIRRQLPARTLAVPFGTFLAPSIWLVWVFAQAGTL
jgi:leader peptidase (prepilin peptidase) / N-methyltransferase